MNECRCPRHPRTKFCEVVGVLGGAIIEVSCRPCRRDLASIGGAQGQVVHCFDVWGRCFDTRVTVDDVPVETPQWMASA